MRQKLIIVIALFMLTILGACKNDTDVITAGESLNDTSVTIQGEGKAEDSLETTETNSETNDLINEPAIGETDESIGETIADTSNDTVETTGSNNTPEDEGKGIDVNNPVLLPAPPFHYYASDNVTDKENKSIKLAEKLNKPNKITDDQNWFNDNNLSMNTLQIPVISQNITGNLPDEIDDKWKDLIITSAFYDDFYIYCTYGSDYSEGYILNIYDAISLKPVYSLDFSNYRYSPEYMEEDYDFIQQKINWAAIKDNILYVSQGHSTYAKSSKNMNAYITAIDLSDMNILWRTDALVSNSHNFQILKDVIICGYGFTDEPDYLYQIDINTGKVLDKNPLKSAASYIIQKNNVLYVRTYNTDYEFDIIQ